VELYIIRHGESTNNVQGAQWVPDPELTALGIAQAERLGERMASVKIDYLLSSPLKRALRTAHEIAKRHNDLRQCKLPVHILHELVETGTDYQTVTHAQALEFCPGAQRYDEMGAGDYGDNYGLHLNDPYYMLSRAYRVISRVRQIYPEESTVVLVGHVGVNQRLIAAALRMSLPPGLGFSQGNTCVNHISYRKDKHGLPHTRLEMMNDMSHLNA